MIVSHCFIFSWLLSCTTLWHPRSFSVFIRLFPPSFSPSSCRSLFLLRFISVLNLSLLSFYPFLLPSFHPSLSATDIDHGFLSWPETRRAVPITYNEFLPLIPSPPSPSFLLPIPTLSFLPAFLSASPNLLSSLHHLPSCVRPSADRAITLSSCRTQSTLTTPSAKRTWHSTYRYKSKRPHYNHSLYQMNAHSSYTRSFSAHNNYYCSAIKYNVISSYLTKSVASIYHPPHSGMGGQTPTLVDLSVRLRSHPEL